MKKLNFILSFILLVHINVNAQTTDTVSQGAGYANQVWYNIQNGIKHTSSKNNWHLAFETVNQSSSIHINSSIGVELWLHATADTSQWSTLDTNGISNWTKYYNSNITWSKGAFNAPANPNNQFDLGWGTYSMITHTVTGDRIFIAKISANDYKKIWIKSLASGTYTFRYANLDNTNDVTTSITKSGYNTKNFIYYNLNTQQIVDREPANNTWDLAFTQYIEFIPSAYLVTGVLHNKNIESVKAYPVDETIYTNWGNHTFAEDINIIGYDWKSFNNQTFQWTIADSTVYFIKDLNNNIWKLVFTGFGGSSNGNYIFTKELLSATGINQEQNTSFTQVYPNPCNDILNIISNNLNRIEIIDLGGRKIYEENVSSIGMVNTQISVKSLPKGIYILKTSDNSGLNNQTKVIVQ